MKLEQDIQKRFVNIVTTYDGIEMQDEAHRVYNELIYNSFEEAIEKAYPRFRKLLDDEVFKKLIYSFIRDGATDPIFWKVASEFKDFLLKGNDLDIDYLEELLHYELLEIEMYMSNYLQHKKSLFGFENIYSLSDEINIFMYNYPIHNPAFDANPNDFAKGEYHLLFYYNEAQESIISHEITPFVVEFLHALDGETTLTKLIENFAKTYELEASEIKEALHELLDNFLNNNIIIKSPQQSQLIH